MICTLLQRCQFLVKFSVNRSYFMRLVISSLSGIILVNFFIDMALATQVDLPEIIFDVYIDKIPDDELSESYFRDEKRNHFVPIFDKVDEYFTTCGWPHNLPTFNLRSNLKDGSSKDLINVETDTNHYSIYYTSREAFIKKYLHSPLGNKAYTEFFDELSLNFSKHINSTFTKQDIENYLPSYLTRWYGFADPFNRLAFIFPVTKWMTYNKRKKTLFYATLFCHEIGHLFGLGHPENRKFGDINLMNSRQKWEVNWDIRNNRLQKNQVLRIINHLKTSN